MLLLTNSQLFHLSHIIYRAIKLDTLVFVCFRAHKGISIKTEC